MDVRRLGTVEYLQAWELQRTTHADVVAGHAPDTLLLLEHPAVYTAGRRTEPRDRPVGGSTPVVDVDRGGQITWHGPGQLVGYPIMRLADPVDVVAFVRRVEDLLLEVCAELGVPGERVEGRSGVWVRRRGLLDAKVAAIGLRVSRGTTMHGFAINADNDLTAYDAIVPCGIRDATVTSLSQILGRRLTVAELLPTVEKSASLLLVGERITVDVGGQVGAGSRAAR